MRAEIQKLRRSLGVTTIYVTHDQTEAMTMGDRIAVMRDGALQQVDTPERVHQRPVNQFVAGFIGSPAMNMVDALLKRTSAGLSVVFGSHELAVDERPELRACEDAPIVLGIRPEDFEDATHAVGLPQIETVCLLREMLGSEVLVHFPVSPDGRRSSRGCRPRPRRRRGSGSCSRSTRGDCTSSIRRPSALAL